MLCGAKGADRVLAVLAASKLWVTLAVIDAMDIHLAAAVGAVHQAGQRVGLAPAIRVAPTFARMRCTLSKVSWSMMASWVFSKIVHSLSST